ncbi:MAG TPA: hypothetical protein VKZ88_05130 [Fibrobacteria bacterium]|nr:hypothetical protein [Fibrobacteria bacterium]
MMRLDLLRTLPSSTDTSPHPPKRPVRGRRTRGTRGAVSLIVAVLVLGIGGALWLAQPDGVRSAYLTALSDLWKDATSGEDVARAEAARRAEAVALQASRQIEARQTAVIEWLYQLELLQPAHGPEDATARVPHSRKAPVSLTTSTFTASGEFLLEGTAASAEDLSALQEAMVLIPGMDLRESRAHEIAGSAGPAFTFRFAGSATPDAFGLVADGADGAGSANGPDSADSVPAAATVPVQNRVVDTAALAAHQDMFLRAAAAHALMFTPLPEADAVTQAGALQAHRWKLRGIRESAAEAAGPSTLTAVRELLEHERHRGSPLAIQRITVSERRGHIMVFLDILALTP